MFYQNQMLMPYYLFIFARSEAFPKVLSSIFFLINCQLIYKFLVVKVYNILDLENIQFYFLDSSATDFEHY